MKIWVSLTAVSTVYFIGLFSGLIFGIFAYSSLPSDVGMSSEEALVITMSIVFGSIPIAVMVALRGSKREFKEQVKA